MKKINTPCQWRRAAGNPKGSVGEERVRSIFPKKPEQNQNPKKILSIPVLAPTMV
jgi:hypothetical protein